MPQSQATGEQDLHCPICGYCLRGAIGDPVRCPECGRGFAVSTLRRASLLDSTWLEDSILHSLLLFSGFSLLFAVAIGLLLISPLSLILAVVAIAGSLLSMRKYTCLTAGIGGRWKLLLYTVLGVFSLFGVVLTVVWGARTHLMPVTVILGVPHALSILIVTGIGFVVVLSCAWIGLKVWAKHLDKFLYMSLPDKR